MRGGLGFFDQADQIDGFAYSNAYPTRAISCFGCPIHCGMLRQVPEGKLDENSRGAIADIGKALAELEKQFHRT